MSLMTASLESGRWMDAILGFIIGVYVAMASYVVGTHVALTVDR